MKSSSGQGLPFGVFFQWSFWKLLKTQVEIYISPLTTANLNLFPLGHLLLMLLRTPLRAWVQKLGESTKNNYRVLLNTRQYP